MNYPKVFTNEKGIWREDQKDSNSFGILWEEIYTIHAYKEDEIYLELDFQYGKSLLIIESFSGFKQVIKAIKQKQLYLESNWYDKIKSMTEDEDVYKIWGKS